jgi:branched-chain amino acid transport system permease protein
MAFFWHIVIMIAVGLPNILGFNLIFGRGKIFHFGPVGVSIAVAYGTFIPLMAGFSYPLALLIGLVTALVVSLIFAWLSFRLDADGLGVMSIAVHLGLLSVVLNWQSLTRGALGIPRIPRFSFLESLQHVLSLSSQETFALFSIAICCVWVFCVWLLDRGPFGRSLQALAEQPLNAAALGIQRVRVHAIAFAIGAVGALITNVLFHQYILLVHPSDFSFATLIFFVMVVVAGRPGSVRGTVIACILLTFLREGLRFVPLEASLIGPVRLILFGIILLLAVWWRRDVLFPPERGI